MTGPRAACYACAAVGIVAFFVLFGRFGDRPDSSSAGAASQVLGGVPAGEPHDAGDSPWPGRVAAARPHFDSVTQSSNVDSNRKTTDRATVTASGNALLLRVEAVVDGAERFTLSTDDARDIRLVPGGYRYEIERADERDDGSTVTALIYELPRDTTLGHWIRRTEEANAEVGVFVDGPLYDQGPVARSGEASYRGVGYGVVNVEGSGAARTALLDLEVLRFYANFDTRAVHADLLDKGSQRRVILRGSMADDRRTYRGDVMLQADGGLLIEVGTWGGTFSSPEAQAAAFTLAYEYELGGNRIVSMAAGTTSAAVPDDEADGVSVTTQPADELGSAAGNTPAVVPNLTDAAAGAAPSSEPPSIRARNTGTNRQPTSAAADVVAARSTGAQAARSSTADENNDGVGDDDGSGGDDDGRATDDDDGLGDDDGSGGDDDGQTADDDDGIGDDDGSGGDDDGTSGEVEERSDDDDDSSSDNEDDGDDD